MAETTTTNSYLDPPQLMGKLNADGTYTLSALEMKAQSDFNRRVAQMIQGGLNLANLNKDTNTAFNGKVAFVDLSTGGSTVINGANITTGTLSADRVSGGTLQGVKILSVKPSQTTQVKITDGAITLGKSDYVADGELSLDTSASVEGRVWLRTAAPVPLKLDSGVNMSIDCASGSTIYIGTSNTNETINIGSATGNVNLVGTVTVNGNPI